MTELIAEIRMWCTASGFSCDEGSEPATLQVGLDAEDGVDVRVELPVGDHPLRLNDRIELPAAAGLPTDRFAEVVEDVVLGRSSLVDARPAARGLAVEIVVVVYPDAVTRHNVLAALFEIQKIRLVLRREVEAAVAAERTVASLEALAGEVWEATPASPVSEPPRRRGLRRRPRSA
jgi:hypothetical protein